MLPAPPGGADTTVDQIRNFCIIAHIDHGKSTLADRLIQRCGGVEEREFRNQILDTMELERERGITIKSNTISLPYTAPDGREYELNLIDTPGHVDFSHEVRRSLMAAEGALLVVDASQGVEAQTVANLYLAVEYGLEILPVINKIDLPSADPERVMEEIDSDLGLDPFAAVPVSAKLGTGIDELLAAIVERLPPPGGDPDAPLQALLFDAQYDPYRGAVLLVRVMDGRLRPGMTVRLMHSEAEHRVEEVGRLRLKRVPADELVAGEVGYLIAGIKSLAGLAIGDTLTAADRPAAVPVPGYREAKPVVFSSIFPMATDDYEELTKALEKLKLNDAALIYEKDSSAALGFGFRCGFLGLLHMDIVRERLEREYGLELITTMPNVEYHAHLTGGGMAVVRNPAQMPEANSIERVEEPYVTASILVPSQFVGTIMELCQGRRADFVDMKYLSPERVEMHYRLPLAEIVLDFFDQLKTRTRGYASLDYDYSGYRASDLVKLDVLLAGEPVDALSLIIPRESAHQRGKALVTKLRQKIPRQLFEVPVQAAIGNKVVARETVKAVRKDVTAKCYGGDISRKRKLLEKQKEGKKRMKQLGVVEVPQEAFLAVLELEPGAKGR